MYFCDGAHATWTEDAATMAKSLRRRFSPMPKTSVAYDHSRFLEYLENLLSGFERQAMAASD
jgi:hypothetical protein